MADTDECYATAAELPSSAVVWTVFKRDKGTIVEHDDIPCQYAVTTVA